jgi:predicted RNA binding protein YcfA (HicA-like mRNA interferase family)
VKRRELIRELELRGCRFKRAGGRHDIYVNPANGQKSPVPRHNEIKDSLCKVIRKQLGLQEPE